MISERNGAPSVEQQLCEVIDGLVNNLMSGVLLPPVSVAGTLALARLHITDLTYQLADARALAHRMPADEPEEEVPQKSAKAAGAHRHKFGDDGKCTVESCGKPRGRGGRPTGPAEPALSAAERTLPLPAVEGGAK